MRFLCGDMSEGPKQGQTVFALSIRLRKQPVKFFKEFARRRPLEMNKADSPFSQSNISKTQMTTCGIWEVRLVKTRSANFSPPLRKMLAPVVGKPISANLRLNRPNPRNKILLRLNTVPRSSISTIQGLN